MQKIIVITGASSGIGLETKKILEKDKWSSWMSRIDKQQVNDRGCDSVFAQGGADLRNDEYIVYDSTQVTIRYLIELTER